MRFGKKQKKDDGAAGGPITYVDRYYPNQAGQMMAEQLGRLPGVTRVVVGDTADMKPASGRGQACLCRVAKVYTGKTLAAQVSMPAEGRTPRFEVFNQSVEGAFQQVVEAFSPQAPTLAVAPQAPAQGASLGLQPLTS